MDLIRNALERFLVKSQLKIKKVNQNTKKVVQKSDPNQQKWIFWAKKAPKSLFFPLKSIQAPGAPSDPPMVLRHDLAPKGASHKTFLKKANPHFIDEGVINPCAND